MGHPIAVLRAHPTASLGQQALLLQEAIDPALTVALPAILPQTTLAPVGIATMEALVAFQKSQHLVVDLEVQEMINNPIAQARARKLRFLRV